MCKSHPRLRVSRPAHGSQQCSTHSSAPPAAVPMPPPFAAPKLAAAVSQTRTASPRARDVVMLAPRPAAATSATRPARHAATAAPPHAGGPRPVAEEAAATRARSVVRTWDAATRGIYAARGHVSRLSFCLGPGSNRCTGCPGRQCGSTYGTCR